jgi:hypothetical protein
MIRHTGGHKYCPNCKIITETRVLPEGYGQIVFRGVPVKRRKIICGKRKDGLGGCKRKFYTYEIVEDVLPEIQNSLQSRSGRRKNRKGKARE